MRTTIHALAGWLTVLVLLGAYSTFTLKQIGREYVKRLPREYAGFADAYRGFMRFMVRSHRFIGAVALAGLFVHAALALYAPAVSVSGLAAGLAAASTAVSGAYGLFLKLSLRSGWLTVHRALAFVLFIAAAAHLLSKGVVSL